ncbi:MAG: lipopolysaccharide transport periplasmic protein LptA [Burkholderiales bacterium]|nr:lipopolysaccharide transport periplasmic protein LptA [Burkholderiales bacterium]
MWPNRLGILLVGACCAGLLAVPAQAEKADRSKPINLESDRMHVDDVHKTSVFEGKVLMTQGTLSIRADKIIVRQDKDGYQYGSAFGNPATFRQKRDGAEGYIQGEAERIEYDGKLDRVEFFDHARLLREPADEVRGNYISYDARTEYFTVTGGGAPSASGGPGGRVHAVIQPRAPTEESGKSPSPDATKR